MEAAARHVVQKQIASGVDVGNIGEQPWIGFQTCAVQRMRGFGGESKRPTPQDLAEFPDFTRSSRRDESTLMLFPNVRFTGFDVAVSLERPVVIELNVSPDLRGAAEMELALRHVLVP